MTWQTDAQNMKNDGVPIDDIYIAIKQINPDITRQEVRNFLKSTNIDFKDKREYTDKDIDAYMDAVRELQKVQEKLSTRQVNATIEIKDDKPIGIAFWGDWHTGGIGVDYDGLDEDTDIITTTDGLYWAGTGDYKDNYQTYGHAGAQYEQLIQPGMQDKAVRRRIEKTGNNCIAMVRGCHDDWDKKGGDKDFIETLCEINGAVNLWHGGNLYITIGTQTYHIKLRHKYPFESGINVENSMRRIFEKQGACDIAISAHLHDPYFMMRSLSGQQRILGRSGSYKKWDEYGQKLAGYEGSRNVPVVILWPYEKRMHVSYLRDSILMLKAART